jgi:hypothetical protein
MVSGLPPPANIQAANPLILKLDSKHPDLDFPALIACSEVVMAKLGYGTCGECIITKRPMVYVKREGFIEEEGLLKLMMDKRYGQGRVLELPKNLFDTGTWSQHVEQAAKMNLRQYPEQDPCKGEQSIVSTVIRQF